MRKPVKTKALDRVKNQGKPAMALFKKARDVRRNAYAPYSRFKVGAALRDEKGRVHVGCNAENASYGGTLCAERGAVTAMVAAGGRDITEIFIVTDTPEGCPPCGFCRQVLSEFSSDPRRTKVHIATLGGQSYTLTLAELLPHAFNAKYFG